MTYNELIERRNALIAHPEHDHRVAPEIAAIDRELYERDMDAIAESEGEWLADRITSLCFSGMTPEDARTVAHQELNAA